ANPFMELRFSSAFSSGVDLPGPEQMAERRLQLPSALAMPELPAATMSPKLAEFPALPPADKSASERTALDASPEATLKRMPPGWAKADIHVTGTAQTPNVWLDATWEH